MANITARVRGRRWVDIRKGILDVNPLCVHCLAAGLVTPAEEVDHIIPLFKGGNNRPENLQPLCYECHQEKTAIDTNRKPIGAGVDGLPTNPRHPWNAQ